MCQLFASLSKQKRVLNETLKSFFAHSVEHPHGWGLALLDEDNRTLEKEPVAAHASAYLRERLMEPIAARTAFAHIRQATIGVMDYSNCHPFVSQDAAGRRWTLMHNGTIFHAPALDPYVHIQTGTTDSERILLYLVSEINHAERGGPLSAAGRFAVLDRAVTSLAPGNKLNLMLHDGEIFYVHTNYPRSLHRNETEEGLLFATQPLDDGKWEELPLNTLLGYRGTDLLFTGKRHSSAYVEDLDQLRLIYLAYANL